MPQAEPRLTEVRQLVQASTDRVFAELADGWAYVGWVVGATHIRDVDESWPEVGSKIHHQVGGWPAALSDDTESMECEPGRRLVLRAKAWPMGEAVVEIVLVDKGPHSSEVILREAPIAGPAAKLDNPGLRWVLHKRNVETLRRLRDRAEHRRLPTDA